jgi:HEAT repeat protein
MGRRGKALVTTALLSLPAVPALPAFPALPGVPALPASPARAAQIPFEQAQRDLQSADAGTRLRTVQMLKDASYPEAAVPLARLVNDPQDQVQLEAIAAELNIFLAERVVPKKRVGFVVEKRAAIAAEAAFSAGPSAIGARPVPLDVLTALRAAARDDNPRVALESLYAFGVLAVDPDGAARRELLRTSGPEVAALVGASDPALRYAAVRVMGRVFAPRAQDEAIEPTVGDAVITALNDSDRAVKAAAMQALGTMRYDRAVQALTDLFQYFGKGESAEAALDALARIANPASVPLFAAQVAGKSSSLRGIAIEGLARAGDATRLADVQTAVGGDRNDSVALAGAFATALLGNGSIDRIIETVTKSKLRDQARQYLVELAPGRSEAFSRHLMDPDPRIRLEVVEALGIGRDPAALPLVEPLVKDKDPLVARAAERAVVRLRAAQRKPVS